MTRNWAEIADRRGQDNRAGAERPAPAPSAERLQKRVEQLLTRVFLEETKLSPTSFDPAARFHEYGIESVTVLAITRRLESITGELPKTLFFEHESVRALAAALTRDYETVLARALESSANPAQETPSGRSSRPRLFQSAAPGASDSTRTSPAHDEPIAIVGISGRYPEAGNLDELWTVLAEGRDCIREVPRDRFDAEAMFEPARHRAGKIYAKWGGFLRDIAGFDHRFFGISKADADFLDPQERLWLETAWHTLEDAGYTPESLKGLSVGVFVGVMSNMYQKLHAEVNGAELSPFGSFGSIANRTSYQLDLSGPSLALDTMCSSSLTSIHLACESIRRGESDLALAGGVNVIVHPDKYVMQCLGGWFSSDGRCRSFGEGGDGYVPGEGVGAVLLKSLSRAERDGDHVYALIRSTAVNHSGRTNSYFVPTPNSQAAVIEKAWRRAGIDPRQIGYFEAHGTGTALGDPIEIRGISKAFEAFTEEQRFCALGSIKSNVGHLESAAGIAAVSKVVLQLQHRKLVPSLHSDRPNPHIDFEQSPVFLQRRLSDWPAPSGGARLATISSFGAGGANAHLVIEEYTRPSPDTGSIGQVELVLLSAPDRAGLERYARSWLAFLDRSPDATMPSLAEMAYTTQVGRVAAQQRLALAVHSVDELRRALNGFVNGRPDEQLCFTGSAEQRAVASALLEGPEGAAVIELFAKSGDFARLARLWTLGVDLDFAAARGRRPGRRASVPGYPFAPTRCWLHDDAVLSAVERSPSRPRAATAGEARAAEAADAARSELVVATTPDAAFADAEVQELVAELLAQVSPLPRSDFTPERRLFTELGVDSIMLANFNARLLARYPALQLQPQDYSREMTIAELVAVIAGRVSATSADIAVPARPTTGEPPAAAGVADASLHFELFAEVVVARERRARERAHGLIPLEPLAGPNGALLRQDQRQLANFTSYDFLGLSVDPTVKAAAVEAARSYGASASASRPVGGEIPLYREFETELAQFMGVDAAVLFVSGHATNVTTIELLLSGGDLALIDESSAGSGIAEGSLASGAEVMLYPRADLAALDRILSEVRSRYRRVLIGAEAVGTSTGELANLPELIRLKEKHKAFLLVDEDNSFGVLGSGGRGLAEHFGVDPRSVDVVTAGLNKSLGSCGGFIAGDAALVHYVKCTATSLIFAASLAPMSAGAAHGALRQLTREPERAERARQLSLALRELLRDAGWDVAHNESPLIVLPVSTDTTCLLTAKLLRDEGYVVEHHLRDARTGAPPMLRIITVGEHSEAQLRGLVAALGRARAQWPHASEADTPDHRLQRDSRLVRTTAQLTPRARAFEGEVPERFYRVAHYPEYVDLVARQANVPPGQQMYFRPHESVVNDRMVVEGKTTINFSSFNYLSLSGHAQVIEAVVRAIDDYGCSTSAPRPFSGTLDIHRELERELAAFIGVDDAVVFDAGHNTNVSSLGHLFGPGDLVLHDSLAHNSMIHGAVLSGAARISFPHNDWRRAGEILAKVRGQYRRACIAIEGVYSQDGDVPDLARFVELKHRHRALLFVDEAHSIGVIGRTGRGVCEHAALDPREIDILMGTLSKALATSGGYIAGSAALVDYLRQIPCYVHNINISAAVAAAAREALRLLKREPERVARLGERAAQFLRLAREEGLDTGLSKDAGVVALMTYDSALAYGMSHRLFEHGITAHPFTYPVVPENEARIRIFLTADHTPAQIEKAARIMGKLHRELKAELAPRAQQLELS